MPKYPSFIIRVIFRSEQNIHKSLNISRDDRQRKTKPSTDLLDLDFGNPAPSAGSLDTSPQPPPPVRTEASLDPWGMPKKQAQNDPWGAPAVQQQQVQQNHDPWSPIKSAPSGPSPIPDAFGGNGPSPAPKDVGPGKR